MIVDLTEEISKRSPLKLEPSPPYTNAPKDSKSEPFKKAEFTENEKKKKPRRDSLIKAQSACLRLTQ